MWSRDSARELSSSLKVSVLKSTSLIQNSATKIMVGKVLPKPSNCMFAKSLYTIHQLYLDCVLLHTVSVMVSQQLWSKHKHSWDSLQLSLSSPLQVWPTQCWLLCLQFMVCTPHSTQSCSTRSLAHPGTYLSVRNKRMLLRHLFINVLTCCCW